MTGESAMPKHIRIKKAATLTDIERHIDEVEQAGADEVHLWLPRDTGTNLFKNSWLCALFATTARSRPLIVRDWIQEGLTAPEEALRQFTEEIEGVAAAAYASTLSNATANDINL